MGGGMILMIVLISFLPVSEAMVLHGLIQLVSNGSRVGIHFKHVRWEIIIKYILGAVATLILFKLLNYIPSKTIIYLLLGTIPFLGLIPKLGAQMSIMRPGRSFLCAALITCAQLLAGASGPVLDIFFINAPLSRFEILGTKAVTQCLGHLMKIIFYGSLLLTNQTEAFISIPIVAAILVLTLVGNFIGAKIVARMNDHFFKKVSRYFVFFICVPVLAQAIKLLLA